MHLLARRHGWNPQVNNRPHHSLRAGFFFLHCGGDVGRAELFVTTILSQLAASEHRTVVCKQALQASTSKAVSGCHKLACKSRQDQCEVPVIGQVSQLEDHARTFGIAQACDPTPCDGRRKLKPGSACHIRLSATVLQVISKWDDARKPDLSHNHERLADLPRISRPHRWEGNKTRACPQRSRLVVFLSPFSISDLLILHTQSFQTTLSRLLAALVTSFVIPGRHRTFHLLVLILDRACTRDQVSQVSRAFSGAGRYYPILHFLLSY
jgi:hypothetical protein